MTDCSYIQSVIAGSPMSRSTISAFAADLKAWIKRCGYTRETAATVLRVPKATLDGWCAGRPPALEGTVRLAMELIEGGVKTG